MTAAEKARVRVLADRTLSLNSGTGVEAVSTLHQVGDELELPAGEAKQLEADGFVEIVKSAERRRGATRGDSDPGDESLS